MSLPTVNGWNKFPCVRLLIGLVTGILLQCWLNNGIQFLVIALVVCFLFSFVYSFLPVVTRYRIIYLGGSFLSALIIVAGGILYWLNDTRHNRAWFGHSYKENSYLIVTIEEPLVEKANSMKALASVQSIINKNQSVDVTGTMIIYFKKDSSLANVQYGTRIIFNKTIQCIQNSGNPAAFDYQRYCLFQGITHQVYLTEKDFQLLPGKNTKWLNHFIFRCTEWVTTTMKKFIPGEKEQGLAEALLIGYKNDLDKSLVQSYSNTGVVHVIAISGLHLGLIYWLLLLMTKPLGRKRQMAWLRLVIILSMLWLFSILAGAQPSVLRSAVMFSFIALGEVIDRKGSVYNTLALSAFVLLCYNPYWLWDVGFQLSYSAVLSILIFFKPVYNWFYFENKLLDFVWKLNAVTIAAQLLTLPVSVYHFHQVPTLFIFTNLVAVPLSSIIVLAEILLCTFFFSPQLASLVGIATGKMIWCMNRYIERWSDVSFSIWSGISISIIQTVLLTGFIISFCFWLIEKKISLLWFALFPFVVFSILRSASFIASDKQKKLIVYNIPKHKAIDLIDGRELSFIGDSELISNEYLKNFYLQPSRIECRIKTTRSISLKNLEFFNTRILIIDGSSNFMSIGKKTGIDIVILSGNPKFYVSNFLKNFSVRQIVIDSSVPAWKSKLWEKDCDSLHVPCHNVSDLGAFVMNL